MGSFNVTCGISDIPIDEGDVVVCIPLTMLDKVNELGNVFTIHKDTSLLHVGSYTGYGNIKLKDDRETESEHYVSSENLTNSEPLALDCDIYYTIVSKYVYDEVLKLGNIEKNYSICYNSLEPCSMKHYISQDVCYMNDNKLNDFNNIIQFIKNKKND